MAEVAEAGPEDARRAVDVAAGGVRERSVAADERARARPRPHEGILPDPRAPRGARAARGAQRRQADHAARGEIEHRRERLRVLGRRREQDLRRDDPDRAAGHRRDAPRARRRLRADHPVELPGGDRLVEDRARARVRQHRRREAGVADAAHGARARRHPGGGRAPRGHALRPAGSGLDDAGALDRGPARREDLFTGSTEVGIKVMQAAAEHHARLARARRQVRQRRVRRRRPRRLRREVDLVRVRQRGAGLLRPVADVRAAPDLRRVRRALREAHGGDRRRRAARGGDRDGSADLRRAAATSLEYLEIGVGEGARRVVGGDVPDGAGLLPAARGARRRRQRWRVAQEEIFGPVACVIPFDDEDEAIRMANDSPYGLSGSIWTRDLGRAIRVAKAIRTGVLSVNSVEQRPHRGAVRRLQAERHRPGDGDARRRTSTPRSRTSTSRRSSRAGRAPDPRAPVS